MGQNQPPTQLPNSGIGNTSGLTSDQLLYLMQNKREKFNNSALVSGSRQFDELNNSMASQVSGQIRPDPHQSQVTNLVNLNKLYQQKRTPTSMAGQSHEHISGAQASSS